MNNEIKRLKENNDPSSIDKLCEEKDWKYLFSPEDIAYAEKQSNQDKLSDIQFGWHGITAIFYPDADDLKKEGIKRTNKRHYSVWGYDDNGLAYDDNGKPYYDIHISVPSSLSDNWNQYYMECYCKAARTGSTCRHEATLLAYVTKQMGGKYLVEESDYDYQARLEEIRRKQYQQREKELTVRYGNDPVPALRFFQDKKDRKGIHIYDMKTAIANMKTSEYCMQRARDLLKTSDFTVRCHEDTDRYGNRVLHATMSLHDETDDGWFSAADASIKGNILHIKAADGYRDNGGREEIHYTSADETGGFLNINALILCTELWNECDRISTKGKDLTDEKAKTFFAYLDKADVDQLAKAETAEVQKNKNIILYPRIIMEDGNASLSFKIGSSDGKLMILKNMRELNRAYSSQGILELSKKESLNFSKMDFTDDSLPLFNFIERRLDEVYDANSRFESRNRYSVRTLTVTSSLQLQGALLDGFYDTWAGKTAEYTDKSNNIKGIEIPIGHKPLKFALTARKITDARGTFAGVAVDGLLPVLLEGSGSTRYTLNARGLSRITKEEQEQIEPFDSISDSSGYFRFQVGMDHLQEFYYRVVPSFLNNKVIQFKDECEEEAESYLPPEPQFSFWMDCEDLNSEDASSELIQTSLESDKNYKLTVKAQVSYEDSADMPSRTYTVLENAKDNGYRDHEQENRVDKMLRRFFPRKEDGLYSGFYTDDELFDFLKNSLPVLERYGTVQGTDAFRRHRIRQVPAVKLGVSVDSGLMDLSLTSQGLTQDELLSIFESYQKKKRFHKLSSGDYLDLSEDHQILEIQDLLAGLDLSEKDIIEKSSKIPLFRALYLEKLLEAHENIVSSRDRIYRSLIRSFHTVKDAETEPPVSLENILRPYQTYGFKWIKTLENAGFSGILADEMGLGKTLQMIAVLLSDYSSQKKLSPSLIVCPASLVYNWQEEFSKFATNMKVIPVTGSTASRKKAWDLWDNTQVYIMSYDLMKRNIAELSGKSWYYVILDEAQYIKNAGAAVTKSVKALKAQHRFALTGTPIENRLSELWSIFDFLMPGFLYDRKEFEKKLEIPITKNKDEDAVRKLQNMTSPFILRRRKEEVLKDLPEKMEEVRYVPINGEQQKLYDAQVLKLKGEIRTDNFSHSKVKVFAELTRIREICCDPSLVFENYQGESAKREACIDLIQQAIDGGHRMLVFSQFTSMLALLEEDLKKENIPYYLLTGATPKEKRIQMVHDFNEGDTPVFLISLKAGGTGLNLTGADVVIHYDPWWNLAAQNQATDRTHRIGQTKQVTVYKLIMKDTIEERILDLQNAKKDLAESVLSGDNRALSSLSKEELLELLG